MKQEFSVESGLSRLEGFVGRVQVNLLADLIGEIREGYPLNWLGIHGASHWARVLLNGIELCSFTGANLNILAMFSLFHDSRRVCDLIDPDHGRRGGALARSLLSGRPEWDEESLSILCEACEKHTAVKHHPNPTIQTCWDADRLDLPRIGAVVDPAYLGAWTKTNQDLIARASGRAREKQYPFVELFECARGKQ